MIVVMVRVVRMVRMISISFKRNGMVRLNAMGIRHGKRKL